MIQPPFRSFGISDSTLNIARQVKKEINPIFNQIEERRLANQLRVIKGFQENYVSEAYFGGSTGYGYNDQSREQLEGAFAYAFGAQKALVRLQIVSGTHAIALCLFALLRSGDQILSVTGPPYDTIEKAIGCKPGQDPLPSSLARNGVLYGQVDLKADGSPDLERIAKALNQDTRLVFLQKSRGYTKRRSLTARDIRSVCQLVHSFREDIIVFVDNCYGEFVETVEPCMVGADLCAGSLIKNPGGGLAPTGGYVAGRRELVDLVADRLYAPGLGGAVGPTLGLSRLLTQGLYQAAQTVAQSVKGAVFAAALFARMGLKTEPLPADRRGDIVQVIECQTPEKLNAFVQMIQKASPVDFFVQPEPGPMPCYDDPVIMAAGAFVQGSSIELSADGPLRPPYPAYMQGGLCFDNIQLACLMAAEKMMELI